MSIHSDDAIVFNEREDLDAKPRGKLKGWLLHALCLIALMWTPLVNGQAFFFYDTTNYIRAADMALYLASDKRVTTVWTNRYADQLHKVNDESTRLNGQSQQQIAPATHNDISAGLVMAGRSPYIGALMYIGYLLSNFWLFIVLQAAISYFLIRLSLRRFRINDSVRVAAITLSIALTTSISYYNGLLLADAFAAFCIISILLLATPGRLSRLELLLLASIVAMAVIAHLTHIVILMAMIATLAVMALAKAIPKVPRRAWIVGFGGIAVGLLSIQLTAFATQIALGNKPQLLPLLTARFIADGPGMKFIDSGCDGNKFQICRVALGDTSNASVILSGRAKGVGTYLQATPEQRRIMGQEDVSFAWSVFRFDPVEETFAIARNTFAQLTWVEYAGLNQGCFAQKDCWLNLPVTIREQLKRTLSGKNAWPKSLLNIVQGGVVIMSLLVLGYFLTSPSIINRRQSITMRAWIVVTAVAMIANAGFGGGVVEPQYRYMTRLIWILPLFALIVLNCYAKPINFDLKYFKQKR